MTIEETQKIITELLLSVKRDGMDKMIEYLVDEGFFTSPASTRFHGAYEGGLANHSLGVYEQLIKLPFNPLHLDQDTSAGKKPLAIERANLVIAALLHDVNKVGAYVRTKANDGWTNKKGKDKGHGKLSVERIKKYIKLEPLEEMLITFHMGVWGANEFEQYCGEYSLCGDHDGGKDRKDMTRDEKEASKKARYGKSLRNVWYHNSICFWVHIADMMASQQEKLEGE